MAVTSRKTNLSTGLKNPPKTSAIYTVDAGVGIQESHVQVPLGNAGTLSLGKAYSGTKSAARLHLQATNTRSDAALV